jgi:hypothetical protein
MILTQDTVEDEPKVKAEAPKEKVRYTVRSTKVDRYTTLSEVVPIGPCTCETCGYDPVIVNKARFMTDDYNELDDEGKMVARNVLKKHMDTHAPGQLEAARVRNADLPQNK